METKGSINMVVQRLKDNNFKDLARASVIVVACAVVLRYVFADDIIKFVFSDPSMGLFHTLFVSIGFLLLTQIGSQFFGLVYDIEDTEIGSMVKTMFNHGRNGYIVVFGLVSVVAPLIEEFVYRLIPFLMMSFVAFLFGWTDIVWAINGFIAFVATGVWIYQHGKRAIALVPLGVLYCVLLYNGMLIEAFIAHVLLNTITMILAVLSWEAKKYFRSSSYNAESAPPDAPALPEPTLKEKVISEFGLDKLIQE